VPVDKIVVKEVPLPIEVPVQTVVEKEVVKEVYVDRVVTQEVPVYVEKIVEKEVPVYVDKIVEKEVRLHCLYATIFVDEIVGRGGLISARYTRQCRRPWCRFSNHFRKHFQRQGASGDGNKRCTHGRFFEQVMTFLMPFFHPQVVREVKVEVEVPVDRVVVQEVPVYVDRMVEKHIEVPVDRVITKEVPVYVDQVVEKIVEHVKEVPVQARPQTLNPRPLILNWGLLLSTSRRFRSRRGPKP
jgi:hypothetical protein